MINRIPHKRSLLCAAISLSLLPVASTSFAQQDTVEEVVVTGSYIRRSEGFTQASSVVQLSAEDLEAEGTLNMGEVIQNLSFVNGPGSAITNTIQGTGSRNTTIDLRGLGSGATLTLLDGKRIASENVNMLIPTIAIQRMDIVADGAAALYGNEAVAGVVNFVPYKSYDGFKMDTFAEQDSRGDYDEHSVQMLWGGDIGDIDVVLAGSFRQAGRLEWAERPELSQAGLTMSSNAPGNWSVPSRDANGVYTGERANTIDPNCGTRGAFKPGEITTPFGAGERNNGTCYFEYGDNRDYRQPVETNAFYANATYEVNDDLTITGQFFKTRMFEQSHSSTSNPGGTTRIAQLPTIRGEIPGNPFPAVDANGNQLYGFDVDGNGIPDRNTGVDLNNDGVDDYLVSGLANNGVALNEDIRARRLRPINKTMGNNWNPNVALGSHTSDMDNIGHSTDRQSRYFLQADFTVPVLEGWEGSASFTSNYREREFIANQSYDFSEIVKGLNCDVANDRESCYSPFFVTDPKNATAAHVVDAVAARDLSSNRDELDVIDIQFNGEVPLGGFELPGGPVAMAVGYQRRDVSYRNTPSSVEQAGNQWIGGLVPEGITTGNRIIDAYFAEASVPLLSNLELQMAVRNEEFSTGQSSTDPKFGLTWAAADWLTLRATTGDAFIAPSLEELFNPETCGLGTVTDRFGPFSAFTTRCAGGNPELQNESSTSKQLGFDLEFGNFDFHLTWNETDFENRIITTSVQTIMNLDFAKFKTYSGFTGDGISEQPSLAQLADWVASGQQDPRITRAPDDLQDILLMKSGDSNATTVNVTAIDISSNYTFSWSDWGDFRIGVQATIIDEFIYQEDALSPVIDGAGLYNDSTGAAPNLPELKLNLRLGWTRGNHSINTNTRHYSSMPYDGPSYSLIKGFDNTNYAHNIIGGDVRAWTQMDATYTYRGLEFMGGEMAFSLGSRNVFDRAAQTSPEFAGVIGQLQDPMGRSIYARMVYDF